MNKLKIVLIILLVLILLVAGYFVYDKFILEKPIIDQTTEIEPTKEIEVIKRYKKYKIGDTINFNNEKWYVLNDSSENEDYATIINSNFLSSITEKGITKFEETKIYNYLQNEYLKDNSKLKEVNNIKIRLITKEELISDATYNSDDDSYSLSSCPSWTNNYSELFMATMSETIDTYKSNNCIRNYDDLEYTNKSCKNTYTTHDRYYSLSKFNNTCRLISITSGDSLYYPIINYLKSN